MHTSFLAALLAVAAAQDPAVFRADTHLVQINVIVRDKAGPVSDLDQAAFTLTDHGKPRTIAIFAVHKPPAASATQPAQPQDTFTNRAFAAADAPSGVTMILLDRLNTMIGTYMSGGETTPQFSADLALASAKQHLLKFLGELDPKERVAIYSLAGSLQVLSDFTNDRDQLKRIVENYRATSITSREIAEPGKVDVCRPNMDDGCSINRAITLDRQALAGMSNAARAQTTMAALLQLSAHVAGIPGRKSLVWLTSDIAFSPEAVGRALSRSDIAIYPVDARGLAPVSMAHTQADVGGSVRTMPSRGPFNAPASGPGDPVGVNTMQELAEETGGRAFINSNDLTGAIRKAIDDGAASYTLGFYLDATSLDGKFHELKVRVKRPGVEVRTQRGYYALKEAADAAPPLTSPLETSAIHVDAKVERSAAGLSITGSVDVRDLQFEQNGESRRGAIDIHIVQQDAAGNTLETRNQSIPLQLTAAEYAARLKSGIPFKAIFQPKDALKTLRIIVQDRASSLTGSLIVPLSEVK